MCILTGFEKKKTTAYSKYNIHRFILISYFDYYQPGFIGIFIMIEFLSVKKEEENSLQ